MNAINKSFWQKLIVFSGWPVCLFVSIYVYILPNPHQKQSPANVFRFDTNQQQQYESLHAVVFRRGPERIARFFIFVSVSSHTLLIFFSLIFVAFFLYLLLLFSPFDRILFAVFSLQYFISFSIL